MKRENAEIVIGILLLAVASMILFFVYDTNRNVEYVLNNYNIIIEND